jgi:hypothetical protein
MRGFHVVQHLVKEHVGERTPGTGGGVWHFILRYRLSHGVALAYRDPILQLPIMHNLLFSQIQRSLLMGDVFVTMLAYRKFFPNCA